VNMLQLNPPIPLDTPKGPGFAYVLQDLGPEHDDHWKVLITATGEWWDFSNRDVRGSKNISYGRLDPTPLHKPEIIKT
jgi:hypothetical protein